jgi:hypothetical protein
MAGDPAKVLGDGRPEDADHRAVDIVDHDGEEDQCHDAASGAADSRGAIAAGATWDGPMWVGGTAPSGAPTGCICSFQTDTAGVPPGSVWWADRRADSVRKGRLHGAAASARNARRDVLP